MLECEVSARTIRHCNQDFFAFPRVTVAVVRAKS